MKHACRRMKHFAAMPQNMKHRKCSMKQSLFRLHVFCLEIKAKKWRIRLRPSGLRRDKEGGIRRKGDSPKRAGAQRRQPHKKITLSALCRKQQRKNEKISIAEVLENTHFKYSSSKEGFDTSEAK